MHMNISEYESITPFKTHNTPTEKKVILIGNGFDLAHGIKTSYSDFRNWLRLQTLNDPNLLKALGSNIPFKNKHFTITSSDWPKEHLHTVDLYDKNLEGISISNPFLFHLNKVMPKNWLDIERVYFEIVASIANSHSTNWDLNGSTSEIKAINQGFNDLREDLIKYLQALPIDEIMENLDLTPMSSRLESIVKESSDYIIVNFNYTNTLTYYADVIDEKKIIPIHGSLNHLESQPVIFGYGNQSGASFQTIEDMGVSDYLENWKTNWYFSTSNLSKIIDFIKADILIPTTIKVHIIGLSCGISDSVVLSEIFQNPCCEKIITHHYKNIQNHRETTSNISRHFGQKKDEFIRKTERYNDILKCPQLQQK